MVSLILATTSIYAQQIPKTFNNPVLPGWYADPEAAIFNQVNWIYPTYSDKYEKQVFFDAFSSNDLRTWKKHARILDTSNVTWAKRALWAPAIVEKNGKYFLFFAANDIQSDKEYGGIGIAVADKPEGPFKDYLGKPLIDKFHHGAQPIDQYVFKDRDGEFYMIYGGWGHCNIAHLKNDFTGFIPFADGEVFKEITPDHYVEGPLMFIKDNKYYLMWSEGGWTGPDYAVAYAVADNLLGPFKREAKILEQDSTIAKGAGHHSLFHWPQYDQWFIVYHRRPLGDKEANHRQVCIDKLIFDSNGKIQPVKMTK